MDGEKMKWAYSILLLFLTIGWAAFTVVVVKQSALNPTSTSVVEASGTSVLLGALVAWNGNVNQFWFRKGKGEK